MKIRWVGGIVDGDGSIGVLECCVGAFFAAWVGLLALLIVNEMRHPCLRYEGTHTAWAIIGSDYKGRPIYGPREERTCVEREP